MPATEHRLITRFTARSESGHEAGIFEIGQRIAQALGHVPDVIRFSYDPREMVRTTREVEQPVMAVACVWAFRPRPRSPSKRSATRRYSQPERA